MLFDTHSSVEHLAMMEVNQSRIWVQYQILFVQRVLGPLPVKMVERSKLKYFSKVKVSLNLIPRHLYNTARSRTPFVQGKLKWDEDSSGGRHVRRKVTMTNMLKNFQIALIFWHL